MTENPKSGHNRPDSTPSGNNRIDAPIQGEPDIIELSEIAIGITPEDGAIVELTEDIIGEAFFGFDKATSDKIDADESELDLSEKKQSDGLTDQSDDIYRDPAVVSSPAGSIGQRGATADSQEDDISRQLDNYFGVEEDVLKKSGYNAFAIPGAPAEEAPPAVPTAIQETRPITEISITAGQLDETLERVIRKLYAEKINRILDAMIERTVTEEISLLKDYLIGISGKKD